MMAYLKKCINLCMYVCRAYAHKCIRRFMCSPLNSAFSWCFSYACEICARYVYVHMTIKVLACTRVITSWEGWMHQHAWQRYLDSSCYVYAQVYVGAAVCMCSTWSNLHFKCKGSIVVCRDVCVIVAACEHALLYVSVTCAIDCSVPIYWFLQIGGREVVWGGGLN
jgi:hypothetical protein